MVYDQVHHDPNVAGAGLVEQMLKIRHGAKDRRDVAIIGNVIPVVSHRRGVDRRKPDAPDPEVLQMIKLGDDPGQIPDAVCVTVAKAARVNLISGGGFPPGHFVSRHFGLRVLKDDLHAPDPLTEGAFE